MIALQIPSEREFSPSKAVLADRGAGTTFVGKSPGVSVLVVQGGGKTAKREFIIPIGDQSAESSSDPHGIAVRKKSR